MAVRLFVANTNRDMDNRENALFMNHRLVIVLLCNVIHIALPEE